MGLQSKSLVVETYMHRTSKNSTKGVVDEMSQFNELSQNNENTFKLILAHIEI
jgi:hypothetical protein